MSSTENCVQSMQSNKCINQGCTNFITKAAINHGTTRCWKCRKPSDAMMMLIRHMRAEEEYKMMGFAPPGSGKLYL